MLRRHLLAAAGSLLAAPALARAQTPEVPAEPFKAPAAGATAATLRTKAYAQLGAFRSYYEIHGDPVPGKLPLVLLHGGLMTIDALAPLLPALAATRQVIAVELEGHGRSTDAERPLSYDQMAADLAGLLDQLKIRQADAFGYSMGGAVALRLALGRPDLVRKLVMLSAIHTNDGMYPKVTAMWPGLSADQLKGTPMEQVYMATAPDKSRWPTFIDKMRVMMTTTPPIPDDRVRGLKAPVLYILADADLISPEYAVQFFRLVGGAPDHGGMGPLPASQLAVIPGSTHFDVAEKLDLLLPMTASFLDGPARPAVTSPGG